MEKIIIHLIKRIIVAVSLWSVAKIVAGKHSGAAYHPILDEIGYKKGGVFIEAEDEIKAAAPDIWLHECGHREIRHQCSSINQYLVLKNIPGLTLVDEVLAWMIAYHKAKRRNIRIRKRIVIISLGTYIVMTIYQLKDVLFIVRRFKRK